MRILLALAALTAASTSAYAALWNYRLPGDRAGPVLLGAGLGLSATALAALLARSHRAPPRDGGTIRGRPGEVYLGDGFPWTAACAAEVLESWRAGRPFAEPRATGLFLPEAMLARHALLLGTTGSGKSRMFELMITQAIRRGDAVAVIDPKGDDRLLARVAEECRAAGRPLHLVAPPYPQASIPYNPIACFSEVREVADRIAANLPAGGDAEPFRNFAWEVVNATAAAMHKVGQPLTLAHLRRFALEDPWALVREGVRQQEPGLEWGRDLRRLAEVSRKGSPELQSLVALVSRPVDHTQKMVSALIPLLSKLTSGSWRSLLSPESGGFSWEGLERGGGAAYLYLGSLLGQDSASAVARMALLDFQSYVGRRYAYGQGHAPVSLFIDELGDVASPAFVHVLNKGRGAGIRIAAAAQTLADLETSLGSKARAHQILGNVNTVIQFRAQNLEDAEAFASLIGERPMAAMSEAEAYEPSWCDTRNGAPEGFRALFGRHRNWRNEPMVPPWVVLELPTLGYLARWDRTVVRGTVPLLPAPSMSEVDRLKGV